MDKDKEGCDHEGGFWIRIRRGVIMKAGCSNLSDAHLLLLKAFSTNINNTMRHQVDVILCLTR